MMSYSVSKDDYGFEVRRICFTQHYWALHFRYDLLIFTSFLLNLPPAVVLNYCINRAARR